MYANLWNFLNQLIYETWNVVNAVANFTQATVYLIESGM